MSDGKSRDNPFGLAVPQVDKIRDIIKKRIKENKDALDRPSDNKPIPNNLRIKLGD